MPSVGTYNDLITAINAANAAYPSVVTIDLTADITLTAVQGNMFGSVGLPVITGVVTINGNGHALMRSQAGGTPEFRILAVNAKTSGHPNASLTLNDVTIANGYLTTADNGAMIHDAPVALNNCRVENNVARKNGGIYVGDGYGLTATNTVFVNNVGTGTNGRGGAIYSSTGTLLTLRNCAFLNNSVSGSGSLGGAIYSTGTTSVSINDCCFLGNTAPTGGAIYNNGGTIDAKWNWWGAVNGPSGFGAGSGDSIAGSISGNVTFSPFRPTLPSFHANSVTPTNPCLPAVISGCQISVLVTVNVRRGPSRDDLNIGTSTSPVQLSPGQTFDLRAVADDEEGLTWFGFEHSAHPNYLSWVVRTFDGIDYTDISCSQSANFNTQDDQTLGTGWGNILSFSKFPIVNSLDTAFFPFRGFGMDDPVDYGTIALCAHTGHDFVPLNKSGSLVASVADGIVVGMGEEGDGRRPTLWGATQGGYNLIVRTGGHFVLYGHLSQIEPHLYVGSRVRAGEIIGTIADRGSDTHLHIEVDAYSGATNTLLRSRFGAIRFDGASNPPLVIDPMLFITNRGTLQQTFNSFPTACTPVVYTYSRYNGATWDNRSSDYNVRDDMRLNCFNKTTGQIITSTPATTCLSSQP